ncbi:MAG TPA: hypothetical protein PK677_17215, partial [Acidiphilium sp.]|nr:hypothetical protein [Acidiphilium sp.]HQU25189.1 hypothetical protein [Acidiphilium sp.]
QFPSDLPRFASFKLPNLGSSLVQRAGCVPTNDRWAMAVIEITPRQRCRLNTATRSRDGVAK